jgi:hypothetical protein
MAEKVLAGWTAGDAGARIPAAVTGKDGALCAIKPVAAWAPAAPEVLMMSPTARVFHPQTRWQASSAAMARVIAMEAAEAVSSIHRFAEFAYLAKTAARLLARVASL